MHPDFLAVNHLARILVFQTFQERHVERAIFFPVWRIQQIVTRVFPLADFARFLVDFRGVQILARLGEEYVRATSSKFGSFLPKSRYSPISL